MPLRLGIDLGVTRAGFALTDGAGLARYALKLPCSDGALAVTIQSGASELIRRSNTQAGEIELVVVSLPAEIAGSANGRIGLLVTEGVEDSLSRIGGPDQAGLTRGIVERMSASGNVLSQLDLAAAKQAIRSLLAQQVDGVAICLLHAPRNPEYELQLRGLVQDANDRLPVLLSHQVAPSSGEVCRASAVLRALRARIGAGKYLSDITDGLARADIGTRIEIMQSTGERTGEGVIQGAPAKIIGTDTAARASAAARVAAAAGFSDAIALDVGGEAATGTLIRRGTVRIASQREGSGQAINVPSVDVRRIAGGANAVAAVSTAGSLHVGGDVAVPACMGGKGSATVMDALVVLRWAWVKNLSLDHDGANAAVADVAGRLGLDVNRVAEGIVDVHCGAIAGALRRMAIEKNQTFERLALVASGGIGPMIACETARTGGFGSVVVPESAGMLSALGCATAGKSAQFSAGIGRSVDTVGDARLASTMSELNAKVEKWLKVEGAQGEIRLLADLAYPRKQFRGSLDFSIEDAQDMPRLTASLADRFADTYKERFGIAPGENPELTEIHAIVMADRAVEPQPESGRVGGDSRQVLLDETQVWFNGGFRTASVYDGNMISAGTHISGPALIVQDHTTIVIEPGAEGIVDNHLNVVIRSNRDQGSAQ